MRLWQVWGATGGLTPSAYEMRELRSVLRGVLCARGYECGTGCAQVLD